MKAKIFYALPALALLAGLLLGGCGKEPESGTTVTLQEAHEALQEAYGEDYLPNFRMEKEFLSDILQLEFTDIDEFIIELPMISGQADFFIGIKAAEGKTQKVREALQSYLEARQADTMQYPMNVPKTAAGTVYAKDDLAFCFVLGAYYESPEDASEEQLAKFYAEQTRLGTEALDTLFKEAE